MANGSVHRPPGRAARELIGWAIDLWPYVNGKAIVHGLKLSSMDASDMIDVFHYFFEEDALAVSEIHAETRSQIREGVYEKLYNTTYAYSSRKSSSPRQESWGVDSGDVKPYVPPTEFDPDAFNPFGSVLDAPVF